MSGDVAVVPGDATGDGVVPGDQGSGPAGGGETGGAGGAGGARAGGAGGGETGGAGGEERTFTDVLIEAVTRGNSVIVTVAAFVLAIVVGGLIIAFTDTTVLHAWGNLFSAPGKAFSAAWDTASGAYSAMFEGAIVNPHAVSAALHGGSVSAVVSPLSETAVNATPIILTGLSVALAFRAGLFNIGAASQFIGGAMIAGWIGFDVHLPVVLHAVVAVLGGFAGGAAIGAFVGFLKARTGAHEVIVTIMLNYVMEYLLLYLLGLAVFRRKGNPNPISPVIAHDAVLPQLFGHGLRVNVGFLIALAAAAGMWWLLHRSTTGFQVRTVGSNPRAARSAGMSPERTWIIVMLLAGGLAGLAGAAVVQGMNFDLAPQIYGTYNVDAITVALLGRANPGGTVLAGLLFGALRAGGVTMQASTQIPVDIVTIIEALIVLFVAAPPLMRAIFRFRAPRKGGEQLEARGWGG